MKVGRNIELYVPEIPPEGADQVWCWPDTDRKKHHIYKEYQEQLASGVDLNQDRNYRQIVDHSTPEVIKSFTGHMSGFHSMNETEALDFGNRVTKPSRKNFQVVPVKTAQTGLPPENDVALQFGRVNDNTFHLDVRHPFSIMQAFSIALTAFEYRT